MLLKNLGNRWLLCTQGRCNYPLIANAQDIMHIEDISPKLCSLMMTIRSESRSTQGPTPLERIKLFKRLDITSEIAGCSALYKFPIKSRTHCNGMVVPWFVAHSLTVLFQLMSNKHLRQSRTWIHIHGSVGASALWKESM